MIGRQPLGRVQRLDTPRLVFAGRRDGDPGVHYLAYRDGIGLDHKIRLSEAALQALRWLFANPRAGEPVFSRVDGTKPGGPLVEARMKEIEGGRRVVLARTKHQAEGDLEPRDWCGLWFHDGRGGETDFSMPETCLYALLEIAQDAPARLREPYPSPITQGKRWVVTDIRGGFGRAATV